MVTKKDNYTLNDLVIAVAKGFEEINEKVDKRFDGVDKRLNHIESELKTTRSELSLGIRELKEEIERLDIRIDKLFKQSTDDISVLIEEQDKIKLRLKKLELKNS